VQTGRIDRGQHAVTKIFAGRLRASSRYFAALLNETLVRFYPATDERPVMDQP
jgi:hypothetical protein